MPKYVAIWIDHKVARMFHIHSDTVNAEMIAAPSHNIHNKHPGGLRSIGAHPDDAMRFFHAVVAELAETEEILVVGPSTAKLDFIRYVHKHAHAVEARIVGVETVDHPTDGQLVAYAKNYFGAKK